MSRFEVSSYVQYRPLYPRKIFKPLLGLLGPKLDVLDLGAGTGFSASSFLQVFPNSTLTLVDPDLRMLDEAYAHLKTVGKPSVVPICASAEEVVLPEAAFDVVLAGSAWHWFDSKVLSKRILSWLRPGGVAHIFEYQFPKSLDFEDLNEWVRRKFNTEWKAPDQIPRGRLKELVFPLREDKNFLEVVELWFDHQTKLTLEEFFGLIVSQSRYLHYERTLDSAEQIQTARENLTCDLKKWFFEKETVKFSYKMNAFTFKKNVN